MDYAGIPNLAIGAFALGAAAVGAIGRLRILEARIEKLSIGAFTVQRLSIRQ